MKWMISKSPLRATTAVGGERRKAVEAAAQVYADLLAETVRAHPYG
jgi:hypothetical protein